MQQKHQAEIDGRKADVARLQDEVVRWKQLYEQEIAPPKEGEQLVPAGEIIAVRPEFHYVTIQGGRNQEVKVQDKLVVFNLTPDGHERRKGVIEVDEVHENTSLASIAEESDLIVEGDYFVPLATWDYFQRGTASASL
jgi:hypothetical protein